jgi:hypothetical protein
MFVFTCEQQHSNIFETIQGRAVRMSCCVGQSWLMRLTLKGNQWVAYLYLWLLVDLTLEVIRYELRGLSLCVGNELNEWEIV